MNRKKETEKETSAYRFNKSLVFNVERVERRIHYSLNFDLTPFALEIF